MREDITNRLHFATNTRTILDFIRSGHVHGNPPPAFSLNSIEPMPDELFLTLNDPVLALSRMNMDVPPVDEATKQVVLEKLVLTGREKSSESSIRDHIEATRRELLTSGASDDLLGLFEKAVSNYDRHKFFCQYDWRFARWGTVEDIVSVTESTFHAGTSFIEFKTKWTPPVKAMERLADTFPSVRFRLQYHRHANDPWITVDIFPVTPFGY